jgi:hypothetical protein
MPSTLPTSPPTQSCPPPSASGIRLACAPVEAPTVPATVYSLVRFGRLQDALRAAARVG